MIGIGGTALTAGTVSDDVAQWMILNLHCAAFLGQLCSKYEKIFCICCNLHTCQLLVFFYMSSGILNCLNLDRLVQELTEKKLLIRNLIFIQDRES